MEVFKFKTPLCEELIYKIKIKATSHRHSENTCKNILKYKFWETVQSFIHLTNIEWYARHCVKNWAVGGEREQTSCFTAAFMQVENTGIK